jgi:GntR family transcriptional regulator
MNIRISTSDGVPVYLQIVNQIKYLVSAGRLSPDEQVPSVRKLAEALVVNPNTVARAYRELEMAGVLTTRRGAGVYVSDQGSPLDQTHKDRLLNERIDVLLAESRQFGVDLGELISRLRERARAMQQKKKE